MYNEWLLCQRFNIRDMLARRLARFGVDDTSSDCVRKLLGCYVALAKKFKPNVISTHLRTICNQWCTSRRFQSRNIPCPFGCGSGEDKIEHCLTCPTLQGMIHSYFGYELLHFDNLDIVTLGSLTDHPKAPIEYLVLYNHFAYLMYNTIKHGGLCNTRQFIRILKTVSEHCPHSRSLVHFWKRPASLV